MPHYFTEELLFFADYCETGPLFSESDYSIAREAVCNLTDRDFKIVYLRFWENHSILEIAALLGMSWQAVDRRLQRVMALVKERCLSNPEFSHNRAPDPIQRLFAALQLQ